MLLFLEQHYKLELPPVDIGCDGDGPLEKAQADTEQISTDMSQYDIKLEHVGSSQTHCPVGLTSFMWKGMPTTNGESKTWQKLCF